MAVATDFAQANLIMAQAFPALLTAFADDETKVAQVNAIYGTVILPEKVSEFFELIYANQEDLPAAVKEAGADVGNFAWVNGFWGLGQDGRGSRMERVLRGQALGKNQVAPEPSAKYAPAAPISTPETPVA